MNILIVEKAEDNKEANKLWRRYTIMMIATR